MNCEQREKSLHGYLDGELDAVRAAEFERHLEGCPECLAELEAQEALRASLKQAALRERAPAGLHKKVVKSLPKSALPARFAIRLSWQWLPAAAAVVLVAGFVGWREVSGRLDVAGQQLMAAEIVDAHVRSLQPGHLSDVVSTDQHTVKPWFNGKVDFAVPVRDFADEGFPLQGGRLEVIDGRTVAALIYGRRKHEVNLFVWPAGAEGDLAARDSALRGYQLIRWRKGGMEYWLVSDLALPDLENLQKLVAQ